MLKKKQGYFNKYKDGLLQLKSKNPNRNPSNSGLMMAGSDRSRRSDLGLKDYQFRANKSKINQNS
jgi:hypothetical protein